MGPLIPLLWTSGGVCLGFQRWGGSLVYFLAFVIPRFTSGATPAECIEVLFKSLKGLIFPGARVLGHLLSPGWSCTRQMFTCPRLVCPHLKPPCNNSPWVCFSFTGLRNKELMKCSSMPPPPRPDIMPLVHLILSIYLRDRTYLDSLLTECNCSIKFMQTFLFFDELHPFKTDSGWARGS